MRIIFKSPATCDTGVTLAAQHSGGAKPRIEKHLPPSLEVFGWCTWDAFYSTVSARGLQEGLRGLHEGGINPRTLIIDDGWQVGGSDPRSVTMGVNAIS
jgi:raffinose synthase